ncbi:transaldolase [Pseudocolwellia sp. AS88]|uniref:transaldolase n=1 Tax=Pseudocolwellia sp. AS88 TaxID=3063958 RepID=UPI0026ED8CEC|nr:transaldolase [Pseudocolwellia sp. AS88]MDO7083498.1 transaldolase [Pseudocolwellia sp. AS88]
MNLLEQLKQVTKVVADSGDVDSIKALNPVDATTNPSLILQAAKLPQYKHLIDDAISKSSVNGKADIDDVCDQLIVNFGCEILKHVPGRISSEVDAKLSFDTEASIKKGRKLIALYEKAGISKDRVLIKLASTWQGIKAAEQLEKEGIACNLTLLFSMAQAVACAEANVTLISPFVGRILDWYKAKEAITKEGKDFTGANDPGVQSVTKIYQYYKTYDYKTVVMGASFRNTSEIIELAGCDLLTISPALLTELQNTEGTLETKLDASVVQIKSREELIPLTQSTFTWQHNEDAMATEKLSEGIRNFAKDQNTLEAMVNELL